MNLRISILINLGLLCGVVYLLIGSPKHRSQWVRAVIVSEMTPLPTRPPPVLQTQPEARPETFRWSQLESTDYPTYVSNLRGIGCPEQTIRDLITADVDAGIFAPRRGLLKKSQTAQASGPAGSVLAQHALDVGLQELDTEEASMIASLLGLQPSAGQVANDAPTRPRSLRSGLKEEPIALPLVLENMDLMALKLNAHQLQAIADLRQSFMEQIGGPGGDTNDPAYRERWQKAQPDINNRLEAAIGRSAYQNLEFQAQSANLSQAGNRAGKP